MVVLKPDVPKAFLNAGAVNDSLRSRPFGFNEDALRRIVDPASQSESGGKAKDERTEADPLHRTANGEFQACALAGWSGFVHAGILSEAAPN